MLIAIVSWIHIAASVLSLCIGAVVLFRAKGTATHRRYGRWYFSAMLVTNVTALLIYRAGVFFFPHWLAVVTLAVIAVGYWAVSTRSIRRWLSVHITCTVVSYYMLVGGAINEAFLRIDVLQPYFPEGVPSPVFGMVHSIAQLAFGILLVVLLRRRRQWLPKPLG